MNRPDLFLLGRKSFTDVLGEISEHLNTVATNVQKRAREDEEEQLEVHIVERKNVGGVTTTRHNGTEVVHPVHELLTSIGGKIVGCTQSSHQYGQFDDLCTWTWTIEKKIKRAK